MLVVLIWFLITGVFGPLFGKLTSVQENNNSSFLPKGAEATQASELIQTFSGKDSFNFPALVLFEGTATTQSFMSTVASSAPRKQDGNNVSLEEQTLLGTETNLRLELALRAAEGRFNSVRHVLGGS